MDFDKLLSLIGTAHAVYQDTVTQAALQFHEWVTFAKNGVDVERDIAWRECRERTRAAFDIYQAGEPIPVLDDTEFQDPNIDWLRGEYAVAEAAFNERRDAIEARNAETLGYADQWYQAALKGAAMDFNLKLIDALAEAAK